MYAKTELDNSIICKSTTAPKQSNSTRVYKLSDCIGEKTGFLLTYHI